LKVVAAFDRGGGLWGSREGVSSGRQQEGFGQLLVRAGPECVPGSAVKHLAEELERRGVFAKHGFFPSELMRRCVDEVTVVFGQGQQAKRVDGDGIHIRTQNGQQLLDRCPAVAEVHALLREALGQSFSSLVDLEDQRIGISANCLEGAHDGFRLHFDRNQLTAVVYLNQCDDFPFVIYPNARRDPKETITAERFDLSRLECQKIYPRENLTVIFFGRRSFHGVLNESAGTGQARYSLQFAFDFGVNDYRGTKYYGE
jgi:hypothetical protein